MPGTSFNKTIFYFKTVASVSECANRMLDNSCRTFSVQMHYCFMKHSLKYYEWQQTWKWCKTGISNLQRQLTFEFSNTRTLCNHPALHLYCNLMSQNCIVFLRSEIHNMLPRTKINCLETAGCLFCTWHMLRQQQVG